ncbi:TIGR04282 family arsenosugar biosynthesis glycosyltransferase [Ostreiculturibacter nitratireducens]|uniref:TIGR04282 family arsenosugar biosynthesis glycosyltransferase n=1 Tax=Ostreiculturibacter nitratireducens TaxID=3075226 RepID=UPI0031B63B8E
MVKEPRAGRVKTRLGRGIGMVAAAWWFRRQSARILREVRDPRWDTVLAVSPDAEGMNSRVWPRDLPRVPQGKGDLGARMGRIFRRFPPGPVVIVGADIPGLRRAHVAAAFAALGHSAAVVGPAEDGGYWLIGLKRLARPPAGLFRGVRWSTRHALADTLATLPGPVAFVDTLADVDEAADLVGARQTRLADGGSNAHVIADENDKYPSHKRPDP